VNIVSIYNRKLKDDEHAKHDVFLCQQVRWHSTVHHHAVRPTSSLFTASIPLLAALFIRRRRACAPCQRQVPVDIVTNQRRFNCHYTWNCGNNIVACQIVQYGTELIFTCHMDTCCHLHSSILTNGLAPRNH